VVGSLALEKMMDWILGALELLGFSLIVAYIVLLKRQLSNQSEKFVLYQKLGVVVQDYLRAREYTDKGRMGEAGKIYENVLRAEMDAILAQIHQPKTEG
jgi:hypothetical protein